MSIKETLERFDEKFVDKQRGTVDLLKDEMPNGDFLRADYIKQFITEEIKLAREEIFREVLSIELSADTKTIKTIDDLKTKYEAFGYGQGWIMKKVEELNKLKK
jgi:5-methylthioribose kinase